MSEAWRQIGQERAGGVLLIGDHASNRVPDDVALGIAPVLLDDHIALDIGVAAVAERLVRERAVDAAILGGVSRLVVDCNRAEDAPGLIPLASDGHAIPGNALGAAQRRQRIARFYAPYHAHIAATIASAPPSMILSLHSFTPRLAEHPAARRPWDIGVLYNRDDRLARVALVALGREGLCVGDQQPYSGTMLNHSMNRHAEANGIPYVGVEMRQDHVADADGQAHMSGILTRCLAACRAFLALAPAAA